MEPRWQPTDRPSMGKGCKRGGETDPSFVGSTHVLCMGSYGHLRRGARGASMRVGALRVVHMRRATRHAYGVPHVDESIIEASNDDGVALLRIHRGLGSRTPTTREEGPSWWHVSSAGCR